MWFGVAPTPAVSSSRASAASSWPQIARQEPQRVRHRNQQTTARSTHKRLVATPVARDNHIVHFTPTSPRRPLPAHSPSLLTRPRIAALQYTDDRAEAVRSLEHSSWDLSRPSTTASRSGNRRPTKHLHEKDDGDNGGNNAEPTEAAAGREPSDDKQPTEERKSLHSGASRVTEYMQSAIHAPTEHMDTVRTSSSRRLSSNSVKPKQLDGTKASYASTHIGAEEAVGALPAQPKSRRSSRAHSAYVVSDLRSQEHELQPENLVGHTSGVCSVLASDDRYIVSCSMDRSVKVWSRVSPFACLLTLFGHTDNVSCVALHTRWLVSGSHDSTLRVYSCVDSFTLLHTLVGHTAHVTQVHLPPAQPQQILSCSDDASVRVWSGDVGSCLFALRGHTSRITCVYMGSARVCTGAADSAIMFWDLPPPGLSLSAASTLLQRRLPESRRTSSRRPVDSERSLSALRAFHVHTATVQTLVATCSVDGTLVLSGSNDGTIHIFNFETVEHVGLLDYVHSPVYSMCLLANRELLCSTGDGRLLHFSDLFRHPLVKSELQLATKWISMLQLRGRTVVCSSEDLLYVVDAEELAVLAVLESSHGFVNSVRWLHDNALISGGQDNVVKVWHLT